MVQCLGHSVYATVSRAQCLWYSVYGTVFIQISWKHLGLPFLFIREWLTYWGRGHLNCLNARSRGFLAILTL